MIEFHSTDPRQKPEYDRLLPECPRRGCEYSFANLAFWGLQKLAFTDGCAVFFSHFEGKSVYPYPIGNGDKKTAVERVILDAQERGLPCRMTCLTKDDMQELDGWFPGQFRFFPDRDSFDYVYAAQDLAGLKGRRFQKKRNHVHKFRNGHPDCAVRPLEGELLPQALRFVVDWFKARRDEDPYGNYRLEEVAMKRAFRWYDALQLEGIALVENGRILALSIGSPLGTDTYDIHFEKADETADGAYAAVNQAFAAFLLDKHPGLQFLNREDDMGLEGLRRAKLSYCPHHMEEKYIAYRRDEGQWELEDEL